MVEDKRSVLMITIPISPPWDNASKNRAYNIALNIKRHLIHLLTRKSHLLSQKTDNIVFEDVYKTKYVFIQKFFLCLRLLKKDSHINVYHFIFQPTFISAQFFRYLLIIKRKFAIQTILNIFEEGKNIKKYIFGNIVLVSSEHMKLKLLKEGFNNIIKINPGVDCERFNRRTVSTNLNKTLGIGADSVVLFSGEYTEIRGINHLLAAAKLVLGRLDSVKFIFACRIFSKKDLDREFRIKMKTQKMGISNRIIFLQTFDDMPELIGLSDITIFPTLEMYDKMDIPMTLLESLAMEKPIIISDISPLNEILKTEVGIKVIPGDHKGLADAIIDLLTDDEKRKNMGKRGRKMVLKYFNIKLIAKKYDELYAKGELYATSK